MTHAPEEESQPTCSTVGETDAQNQLVRQEDKSPNSTVQAFFTLNNPVMLKPFLLIFFLTNGNIIFAVMTKLPFVSNEHMLALHYKLHKHLVLAMCLP